MSTPAYEDMSQTIGARHVLLFTASCAALALVLTTLWHVHSTTPASLRTSRGMVERVVVAAGNPGIGQAAVGVDILNAVRQRRLRAVCNLQYK